MSLQDDTCEQMLRFFNCAFDQSACNKRGMSVSDKKALKILEGSLQVSDGHYQMAIPWKAENPCLPNHRVMTEKRLEYLSKGLSADVK
eukprot:gene717-16395_t